MLPYVLPVVPSNPSSSAVRSRSIGNPVPVIAHAPSVQPAGEVFPAALDDQPLDVEEQVLVRAVVRRPPHFFKRDLLEGVPDRAGIGRRQDRPLGEHHEMRMMNRHQRREKLRPGVLESFLEAARHVIGGKLHETAAEYKLRTVPPPDRPNGFIAAGPMER
jgi:hypothetical protein